MGAEVFVRRPLYFATLTVLLLSYAIMPGRASSHREAPLISADPQADNTDVYAFVSPDAPDTVTLIASFLPFEDPAGGPNFYRFGDNVVYEIKIDNNGDGVEDISYQFRFTSQTVNPNTFLYATGPVKSLDDPNRNLFQTYTVTRVENGRAVSTAGPMRTMYDNVGPASTPNYGGNGSGIVEFKQADGTTGKVFAGQTDDAFFLDLRVFDFLYGGNLSEAGTDSLAGFNVHSIALQVPRSSLRAGSPIIGVWSTTSRPATTTRAAGTESSTGTFIQVSRLGMPLVNELVIGLADKDRFNASLPANDSQFATYVTNPTLPVIIEALFPSAKQPTRYPRTDLVDVFLKGVPGLNQPTNVTPAEMLRLNTSIAPVVVGSQNPLGVIGGDNAGYPNGRRPGDDIVDISLRVVEGALLPAAEAPSGKLAFTDGVAVNSTYFRAAFPYLTTPLPGSPNVDGASPTPSDL